MPAKEEVYRGYYIKTDYLGRISYSKEPMRIIEYVQSIEQAKKEIDKLLAKDSAPKPIRTLADLNAAGRRLWAGPNRDSAALKDVKHHTYVPGPDGKCKVCQQKYDSPLHSSPPYPKK